MRVLVCGGRNFTDADLMKKVLDDVHKNQHIDLVIHGAAKGADLLGGHWAMIRRVHQHPFPADWKCYGRSAGHIRNKQMLDEGKPHMVIAFPGGKGTSNMMEQARKEGLPVIDVREIEDADS